MSPQIKKIGRYAWRSCLAVFLLLNGIAIMQAWSFTHFGSANSPRTRDANELGIADKLKVLFTGVSNPRPVNRKQPEWKYETVRIRGETELEGWYTAIPQSRGTVILFHGYGGEKSSLIHKAREFHKWGYATLIMDFRGSGGSSGNETTIGYKEAEDVKAAFTWVKEKAAGEKIYLLGISMGAAAIMHALAKEEVQPDGVILECPFGTMRSTVKQRFRLMHIPSFPLADLLVFWGGALNGFWAYSHNPETYAGLIKCPTLLLYGARDNRVSLEETKRIYGNLHCPKKLCIYPNSGHESYLNDHAAEWKRDVSGFLERN